MTTSEGAFGNNVKADKTSRQDRLRDALSMDTTARIGAARPKKQMIKNDPALA